MDAKTQQQYAETFHGLHKKGDPLILFNAWDVATAKAIAKASPAVATSSWAVASALGYADGEDVPLDMVQGLVRGCVGSSINRSGGGIWRHAGRRREVGDQDSKSRRHRHQYRRR